MAQTANILCEAATRFTVEVCGITKMQKKLITNFISLYRDVNT